MNCCLRPGPANLPNVEPKKKKGSEIMAIWSLQLLTEHFADAWQHNDHYNTQEHARGGGFSLCVMHKKLLIVAW